jgi:hypothetical protein
MYTVYIDNCRYEIQELKKYHYSIPAHFEHCVSRDLTVSNSAFSSHSVLMVFFMILRRNSYYFLQEYEPTGLCDSVCFVCGRNWIF